MGEPIVVSFPPLAQKSKWGTKRNGLAFGVYLSVNAKWRERRNRFAGQVAFYLGRSKGHGTACVVVLAATLNFGYAFK